MNSDLKYDKINIELRRRKVLELLSKGHSQSEIATKLNVSPGLISLDVQYIREQAKESLRTHIQEKLPYEFARAFQGINDILKRAYDILDKTTDPKLQHQYMTLIMQLWGTVMNMSTDGGVIEQAFKKIEQMNSKPNDTKLQNMVRQKPETLSQEDPGESFSDEAEEDIEEEEHE